MTKPEMSDINELIRKDGNGIEAALDEVKFNIYKKNYDKALELIETIVKEHEENGMYNDAVSEYHCFNEMMEEILYTEYTQPEKEIHRSPIDYALMYLIYGSVLIDVKRFADAEEALEKGMKWNPASTDLAFEHAEALKLQGNREEFRKCTLDIFKYAIRPAQLARCYRNLSYYFVEVEEYETAVCCLLFSMQFAQRDMVQSELYYISEKSGKMYKPTEGDVKKCFAKNKIPYGPEVEILKLTYGYGKHFYDNGQMDAAVYFLDIFAGFVDDDDVEKMLEDARGKVE